MLINDSLLHCTKEFLMLFFFGELSFLLKHPPSPSLAPRPSFLLTVVTLVQSFKQIWCISIGAWVYWTSSPVWLPCGKSRVQFPDWGFKIKRENKFWSYWPFYGWLEWYLKKVFWISHSETRLCRVEHVYM